MVAFFFPDWCDSVRTLGEAPFRCTLDFRLRLLFRRSLVELILSIAKVWLLAGD